MATITSTADGDWSNGATWVGGVAPVDGDKAVINHVVTVNNTSCEIGVTGASDSVLINATGKLKWSRTANSKLVMRGVLRLNAAGAELDMGKDGDEIPAAYTAEWVMNRGATSNNVTVTCNGGLSSFGFYMAGETSRKRVTRLTSSVTAGTGRTFTVADSTGWQIGDEIVFCHSDASNPAATQWEKSTLTAISPLTADFAFGHLSGCYCGNIESNVQVSSHNPLYSGQIELYLWELTTKCIDIRNTKFINFGAFPNGENGILFRDGASGTNTVSPIESFFGNISYFDGTGYTNPSGLGFRDLNRKFTVEEYISFSESKTFNGYGFGVAGNCTPDFKNSIICAGNFNYVLGSWFGGTFEGGQVCPALDGYFGTYSDSSGSRMLNTIISGWGVAGNVTSHPWGFLMEGCDIGLTHGWYPRYGDKFFRLGGGPTGQLIRLSFKNSLFATTLGLPAPASEMAVMSPECRFEIVNKDNAVTGQEIYLAYGTIIRNNSTVRRGASSIAIKPGKVSEDVSYTGEVPATNGETIRIVGSIQFDASFYNSNDFTAPTVKISAPDGTVLTTHTATAAANGAWENFNITATNSTGADANLTITLTANAKTVTTGTVYFDGIALAPFVTKCRHYGFLFDESNPKRVTNATVSAAESTAAAYTGMTVTWGASSSTTITADNTFQKLYDYTQAQGCLNIASAMPLTGVGLAGNPALFAAGNVTLSGAVLNGSGSLTMGAFTLSGSMTSGGAYAFTGGTYSRLTTLDAFSGGQLNIGAAGTYVFSMSEGRVDLTPSAPGTYNFGGGTFSGSINVRNTAAHAVTVQVPSGASFNSTGNTGGAITFEAPQVYQSVVVNGISTISRIQIYDTENAEQLYNAVPGSTSYTWTDPDAATSTRTIRVRIARVDGGEADQFLEANLGQIGTSSGDSSASYLHTSVADSVYNTNAIDGSTITDVTFTDASPDRVNVNKAGGALTYPQLYAAFVYWMSTATGIADDFAYIQAPDTANYIFTAMKIRNTSATPLTLTGGYGRDATSGLVADIIDVAGSTGNIYPQPDHVVAFATGSGVTAQDKIDIANQTLTAAASAPIVANVKQMNDETVIGTGVPGDLWRGGA